MVAQDKESKYDYLTNEMLNYIKSVFGFVCRDIQTHPYAQSTSNIALV